MTVHADTLHAQPLFAGHLRLLDRKFCDALHGDNFARRLSEKLGLESSAAESYVLKAIIPALAKRECRCPSNVRVIAADTSGCCVENCRSEHARTYLVPDDTFAARKC